ncbi:5017_t:CDS:2 [Racocetra persica]|uniref:5017_t:CDS:1 n=1 Tax=Racocetra persica TaxID=160502 RepID=A0ACA9MYD6_9GLOM|nr:5017_t:CDS:2 [Racocetra persica]
MSKRLRKNSRKSDGYIPENQEKAYEHSLETETDAEKIIEINPKEIIEVNQEIDFEAFNQQILKMINNLKSDFKSTEYYWYWIDKFVSGHKFLETISQLKNGLEEYDISLSTNIIISRIRRNKIPHIRRTEIPNITLSRIDYNNYRQKFPSSLKQSVSFSNQLNLHEQLRIIKDRNDFTNEFFTAAKIYTNNQSKKIINSNYNACQITIEVDSDSSLTDTSDSDSEPYTTDDELILQQSSLLNDDEWLINNNDDKQLINNKVLKVQTEFKNI